MIPTEYVWMVLLSALVAANLPFINNRWLALIPRRAPKLLWMRLAELVLLYFMVGAFSLALEQSVGQIAPQDWEFYVTTASMFLTLAFPGFVYCYLYKKGKS
ncbi:DUF2818 family protein [Hydrogenophaga sp.]|uniref:DUF2818 family protein n=1 Tax=Hydrogenophaga sp. TaxID=1904254 RepID=UPI0019B45ED3|nr:DUF2818 family protein [Hydrogenophaga sp.]MBD3893282.1 DUF2818 family protein [Hydrogenophaga sp.]